MSASRFSSNSSWMGFSLAELVVTIAIVGILAAFAIPRFVGRDSFASRGYHDQVLTVVSFAQKTAIAQRRNVFVSITATRVAACYIDATCGSRVVAPFPIPKTTDLAQTNCAGDPTWLCAGSPSTEITVASIPILASFNFDGLGRSSLAAALVISVNSTAPGEGTRTLTVEAETGYVHP